MFVKCSCEQCNGHIEFDEGYAGLPIVCPHCGSETRLFIPSGPLPPPKIKSEASQNDTSAELRQALSPAQTDNAPEGLQPAQPPEPPPTAAAPVTNEHERARFAKSARVIGRHLENRSRRVLFRLARSKNLWHRRTAVLATFHFIRLGDFGDGLRLAVWLRDDPQDLLHKAVGWMLREIGKRDAAVLKTFLSQHAASMPRTMLRYAIENLPERQRQRYLRAVKA